MTPFRDDKLPFADDPLIGSIWLLPWGTDSDESMKQKLKRVHEYGRYRITSMRRKGEVSN